jgi:hypothetical protein
VRRRLVPTFLLVVLALVPPGAAAAAPHLTATPNPIPFGKTLIVNGRGMVVSARAFDAEGRPLGRVETPRPPPAKPGQPSRQPDENCPEGR